MSDSPAIHFDNSYISLPQQFYRQQLPAPVTAPEIIAINDGLAQELGIDVEFLHSEQGLAMMAGNAVPSGAQPIATVYAGHQFGGWNPQLGDGRAILLGEVLRADGQRFDIQLKGAGPTPYSRSGDGRSPLGPVLREYLLCEAMAALGVPSTRALAAVSTGEQVYRQRPLPGAILTRVASSHIRIGTFQFFAGRGDTDAVKLLADHVITRHFPKAAAAENPYAALLAAACEAQAQLIAKWQGLGFIHGVMNTDNMLLSGETIDYGPCAFMDEFNPSAVFSSIDSQGRYAFANQPGIAYWNLSKLAQSLLPLMHEDEEQGAKIAQELLDQFPAQFHSAHRLVNYKKLGLDEVRENDEELIESL